MNGSEDIVLAKESHDERAYLSGEINLGLFMKQPIILDGNRQTNSEEPKIEFPCDYPIKAIGTNSVDLKALVVEVVSVHAPDLDLKRVSINESSKGNFVSVRFTIRATGKPQLKAIHEDLMATGHVKMVI